VISGLSGELLLQARVHRRCEICCLAADSNGLKCPPWTTPYSASCAARGVQKLPLATLCAASRFCARPQPPNDLVLHDMAVPSVWRMCRTHSGFISSVAACRPAAKAACACAPDPPKGSSTRAPGWL